MKGEQRDKPRVGLGLESQSGVEASAKSWLASGQSALPHQMWHFHFLPCMISRLSHILSCDVFAGSKLLQESKKAAGTWSVTSGLVPKQHAAQL